MKKAGKKLLLLVLAIVLLLSQTITSFALWDGLCANGRSYLGHEIIASTATGTIMQIFQLKDGESSIMPLENFETTQNNKRAFFSPVSDAEQADFSSPVPYIVTSEDGRQGHVWLLARPASASEPWTEEEKEEWIDLAPRWLEVRDRLISLLDKLNTAVEQRKVEVGGLQTAYQPMVSYLRNYNYWVMLRGSEVPGYGKDEVLYTEETLRALMKDDLDWFDMNSDRLLKADQTAKILDCIEAYCDEIENDRIAAPELTGFQLGEYKGVIDGATHVTLTVPADANLPDPSEAKISTDGSVKSNLFAGSIESGQLLYRLTPYAAWTGAVYNGTGGYVFDKDLGKTWIVEVKRGDPVLKVQDLSITLGERIYHAQIDDEEQTISLTLPIGTNLTSLTPVLKHTASTATIGGKVEGTALDLSKPVQVELMLDKYKCSYTLTVQTGDSAECDILSYKIGDQTATINGDQITLTLPYGTDPSKCTPEIQISEDATLIQKPASLAFNQMLTYVVQAQNKDTKTYQLTLKETPISGANQILSFAYGSIQGTIDQNQGTIRLEVPQGTNLKKLTPKVQVSEFAEVYPASGAEVDFSGTSPVEYTVTAQNGVTNTYRVTVVLVDMGENPYKNSMVSLRNNIIDRYETKASDDWEWMNLGFYKGVTQKKTPGSLPKDLENHVREKLAKLDTTSSVAMTNLDRTIMMLTACGIDASKLDAYTTEDNPFKNAKGEPIKDLTAYLYNYSGSYTINGPIFALIALDMGNYTIPKNAVWTRDKLLETILTHKYGSDGFGVDMVGMLMQSIAPYQNDPVYGSRVKAKLEEGIDLFLGNKKADTVDAMQPDFTFGGFGYQSSESAAQAICALSAAGVDCHTDARFSDGNGKSALTAFLDYADGEYFAHTVAVKKNSMATYQGCYTVQWYLGFLENGGAGHPYSLYYHQQDFSRPLSKEAEIKSFVLEGKTAEINGAQITVTLPKGTPLTNMTPEITLSDYATLDAPSFPVTFAENIAQPFTVRAEDGETTKTYYVTVKLAEGIKASGTNLDADSLKLQDANILRDIEITARKVTTNEATTDILLSVAAGVDTQNLFIKGTLSYGATTEPEQILDGKTKIDLSGWTTIKVTSEDKENVRTYRIKVDAQETASIDSFVVTIDGIAYRGVIDNSANTIQVLGVPTESDVSSLAPEIELGEGTNVCSPLSGVAQNFTSTVNYTVSGNGLATRVYAVDIFDAEGKHPTGKKNNDNPVTPEEPDTPTISAAKINSFTLFGVEGTIDDAAGTILITLPEGTDVSCVAPTVEVGSGCMVSPVSGEVVDLTSPRVYTVTNGTETNTYTVIVTLEKSVSQQLWEKVEDDSTVADHQVVRD